MVVSGGFLEVISGRIVILADYAERAVSLDPVVIENARLKAEQAKLDAKNRDDVEFTDISARLDVELFKSKAVSRWKRLKNLE